MPDKTNQQGAITIPESTEVHLHGVAPRASDRHGEVHFAVVNFVKAIINAQGFAGYNKFPELKHWVWSQEEADRFILVAGKLQDTFWKIDRVAGLLDEARRKFTKLEEGTYSIEVIVGNQQVHSDFPLYLDMLLIYWRIFADCLASITRLLPGFKKNQVRDDDFRQQKDWFLNKKRNVDPEYATILEHQTNWFAILAGAEHGEGGLRNLLIHESVRTQLFYQPGETPDHNCIHAIMYGGPDVKVTNLVPHLQQLTKELFLFLDSYVKHFVARIEQAFGGPLPEAHLPSFSLLYQFEKELPSEWLYPAISR